MKTAVIILWLTGIQTNLVFTDSSNSMNSEWDTRSLNTAVSVNYLSPLEKEIIFENLKNKIVQTGGNYPEAFKVQAKALLDNGVAISLTPPIIRRREELKLPSVESADINELRKLLVPTNFEKKINLNGDR